MSGAAERCDYPRNVGRQIAPRYLSCFKTWLFRICVISC